MVRRSSRTRGCARGRAYLAGLLRDTGQAAWEQAQRVPARAWRRWVWCLLIGYGVSWMAVIVAVRVARAALDGGLQAWDERLLAALADSAFSFPMGLWFEAWASSAFLVPMLLVAMVLLIRGGHLFGGLTLFVGYLSTKGLVLGAWQLWDRARPDTIADGIAAPALHSFPSGHAINAMVMFGLMAVFWWRASRSVTERFALTAGIAAVIALTCAGRVRLGTHWPSDIIAGLLIGATWLAGLTVAMVAAERVSRELARRG